jgi:hypothetical protein
VSSTRELLALQREVLAARAALQRLTAARDIAVLRESLAWPIALGTLAGSRRARPFVFGALLFAGARLARLLARPARAAGTRDTNG